MKKGIKFHDLSVLKFKKSEPLKKLDKPEQEIFAN